MSPPVAEHEHIQNLGLLPFFSSFSIKIQTIHFLGFTSIQIVVLFFFLKKEAYCR